MVRDIELPFTYHTRMSRCQLKLLLYILTKQNGEIKPKWWPDNIRFEHPISSSATISKESLIDLFISYFKYKGDSAWLRAILFFSLNYGNLTNETDFTSINISGKVSHKGVEFDIVPSRKSVSPNVKINRKLNISPAVVEHFKNNKLEYKKKSGPNIYHMIPNVENGDNDNDIKLCIKESHIKQLMPVASVQLYDVVRYNTVHTKEDFLLKLNLMKTDVLSKLNLLKFRKRLRNTGRDSIKSASEFEKELSKFRSKPIKDVLGEQSKQKEKNKKLEIKVKEKDKAECSTTNTECMDVVHSPLSLEIIDVNDDMNKENENFENYSKDNQTTSVIPISSKKTSLPFQQGNQKIKENSEPVIIDLTLEETPSKVILSKVTPSQVTPSKVTPSQLTPSKVTPSKVTPSKLTPSKVAPSIVTPSKIKKETNNLYQFLNISPMISPTPEKKMKSPKNLKRLKRHSMSLINQKDIKSYFNPIPKKLTPELIAEKIDKLKKVCRPCFVRLDFVKELKPIRSFSEESIKVKIDTLPFPIVIEDVTASFIDLTSDEDIVESFVAENKSEDKVESFVAENKCNEVISINDEETDIKESNLILNNVETTNQLNQKPKNNLKIKDKTMKKKKQMIKIKWPSKRITL